MSPVWRERSTGMPFDAMRKRRPDWVPDGDFHLGLALVDCRHLEFTAERRGDHRDRHPAVEVGAIALEKLVGSQRQENVEVARWPAANAGFAFTGKSNSGAVFNALRDVD